MKGGIPGFSRDIFERVIRHLSVTNYDGTKLKKEPDLCFKFRDDLQPRVIATQYGLFIECKPVDHSHRAGRDYCDDGLQRFVNGEYAWAMQEAMVVAYARDGRSIAAHLRPAMEARRDALRIRQMPTLLSYPGAQATPHSEPLHRSCHDRAFPWLHGKGQACELVIYHAWHGAF